MIRKLLLIAVFAVTLPVVALAEDDFQFWNQLSLNMVDTKHMDWQIFTDTRLTNDAGDLTLYYISNRFKFDYFENLGLQTNHTYIQSKVNNSVASRSEFKFQHRFELEANPKFKLGNFSFVNRNRVEFRWIEDKGSANTRFRHRLTISHPVELEKIPSLAKIYMNTEFFYNHHENAYDEQRSVPLGLAWELSEKAGLNTYYMIQAKYGSTKDWNSNHILGTTLSYKF